MANQYKAQFDKLVATVTKVALKQAERDDIDVYDDSGGISEDMMSIILDISKRAYRSSPFYKTTTGNMLAISCGATRHQDSAVVNASKQRQRTALKFFQYAGLAVLDYEIFDYVHAQLPVDADSDEDDED